MNPRFAASRLPLRALRRSPALLAPPSPLPLPRAAAAPAGLLARSASTRVSSLPYVDNNLNGGYANPPPEKRMFRDPHGDWWDKQDRRNFGEPVHEDNDVLTVFSAEQYTHYAAPKAFFLLGCAVAVFASGCGVLALFAPQPHFVERTWEGDLSRELGGEQALTAKRPDVAS